MKLYESPIQILIADGLHHLWQKHPDFVGGIVLHVDHGEFNSEPQWERKEHHVRAFVRPLTHALAGFKPEFKGDIRLEIDNGNLRSVAFSDKRLNEDFAEWLLTWNRQEASRMKRCGIANEQHGKMREAMTTPQKFSLPSARLLAVERTLEAVAFREITGDPGFKGPVTIGHLNGGIMYTDPPLSPGVDRKKLAKMLKRFVSLHKGETKVWLNGGLPNLK
jgi:hypothetical protein